MSRREDWIQCVQNKLSETTYNKFDHLAEFQRRMCEQGFVKANSNNLPQINMFAVLEFLKDDDRFNAPEIRCAKASLNCRESYGDAAVGYVQVKREGDLCIVKCRVCPEHRVRSKAYSTTLIINEATEKIIDVQCHDCAAATGGCKHALAVLMWVHRRSEDPAPTEIACYWKKSRLSGVGTALKYVEVKDLGIQKVHKLKRTSIPDNSTFLHDVLELAESKQIDCQISRLEVDLKCLKTNNLSLHRLLLKFHLNGGLMSGNFLTFASSEMTQVLCDEAEQLTRNQSDCPLWYELRYGRITASKLYEAAHCTTDSGSFVKQVTGASKVHETSAMLRGKDLEKLVLIEVERELDTRIKSAGLYLSPNYPALGASPDGVKRICFGHALDEDNMRFSCFPRANILGQRGSINLTPLPGYEDSSSFTIGVIRPLPGNLPSLTVNVNGTGPTSSASSTSLTKVIVSSPPSESEANHVNHLPSHRDQSALTSAAAVTNGEQHVNNPRGGVIGRTPTPPSAPTPVYEKDARSARQIKRAILENEFLGNLEENQVEALVSAMYPKQIPANTLVIREGDIGSHLYVSAEGDFDIYEGNKFQRSFGPGVAFGEIALLYNTKRLRSISVKKAGKVWVLDRSVFLTIMMRTAQEQLEGNIRFLQRVSVLQKLPEPKDHVLAKISDLIRVEFFPAGAKILRQGEKGEKFYIISGGNVRITKDTEYGGEEELVVLGKGDYFGELALYDDGGERRANAIALAPGVECLTLDRTSFLNYLGSLDEIRNKDWLAEYEKQKRSLTPKKWTNEYANLTLMDLETRGTLGVGGFGRVELVTLRSDPNKSFALKKLKKKVMVEQQQQEHVLNEKHIMQACDSPFICKLYQTYKDNKYVYFLMEVCLGGDVWTTLQRRRYFDDATAQFMVGCVVEALDHLHSLNIVYRDLKPENLMLDTRGYLKLVDFGFSKKIGPAKTWTFAGTPEYVAPEIILNKGHDRAVDYWALGILTHELLVGKPPFRGADHMTTYNKILKGIEMVGIPSIVNKNANNIIKKLLRLNASERLGYQRNGIQDIRDHKWFSGFNWQALQRLALPAPIVPTVRHQLDTRNFERYPPDRDIPPDEFSGWDIEF